MMSLRIKTFGNPIALSKIEAVWNSMGHQVNKTDKYDFIFDLNGFYDKTLEFAREYPEAFRVFNLLDIDKNKIEVYKEVTEQMKQADVCTTISNFCQKEIKDIMGIDCQVIRYPTIKIKNLGIPFQDRQIKHLFVGRLSGKRFNLMFRLQDIHVVGPEQPLFGKYYGYLNEEGVNHLYNNSKFTICPSYREGLYMPPIEAILAGSIPIVCKDLTTLEELGLQDFAAEPTPQGIQNKILEIESDIIYYQWVVSQLRNQFVEEFDIKNIAQKILDLYINNK